MKTTKTHFSDFQRWVSYYLDRYGLNDWTVYFRHEDIGDGVAQCRRGIISRGVTFSLNTKPNIDNAELDLKRIARHEVCHLLISEVSDLVGSFCSEDELKRADEALVARLTNLLPE